MSKIIRAGVIGVGYLGRIHASIYQRMPNVELTGILDIDSNVANNIAAELDCKVFADINELIAHVDVVSIVTPTITHFEIARPFIENNIHILMEKPIADNYKKSLALVELAEKRNIIFQVGYLERFNAGVVALADHVTNPKFIESHRLGTFVERACDVDVVTDLMIHDIDIILALVKSDIINISATGLQVLTEHPDIANVRLEFANGAVANITASRVSGKKYRQMRVFEKSRYFSLNFEDQSLTMTGIEKQQESKHDKIVTQNLPIKQQRPLDAELAAFIHAVKNNEPPLVDGRTGLKAIHVTDMIYKMILETSGET